MTDVKKPHVSPSQMDMYFRCGEQYRRRYVLGEVVPPGVALIKGGAVHKAAEVNYAQKLASREDLPGEDLEAVAAADVSERIGKDGLLLTPEESRQGLTKVQGHLTDRAVELTRMFRKQVAPKVQPVLVEKFVRIELPARSHDILGRLDVADENGVIRDLKTSSRRKSEDEVQRSDQLAFYEAAYRQETGKSATGVAMDVLVDKRHPEVQHIETKRTDADRKAFLNRLAALLAGLQAGHFSPAPLGSWCCSPRFCGYWWTCPYVNSERSAAAEASDAG